MKRFAVSVLVLAVCGACGGSGGGGGSPTQPPMPNPPPQLAGNWAGNSNLESSLPPGCVANFFLSRPATAEPITVVIQQQGDSLTIEVNGDLSGLLCEWDGNVSGNDITGSPVSCMLPQFTGMVNCPDGSTRNLDPIGASIEGTVSANENRIMGNWTFMFDAVNPATQAGGTVTNTVSFDIQRQ